MTNNDPKRVEEVKDVIGIKGWPKEKGRDGERTPMQWDASTNAGFNKGAATWLPVNPNYIAKNVAAESADPNSMLNWYKSLIHLRREHPAISEGDYSALNEKDSNLYAYLRRGKDKTVLVVLNMSAKAQVTDLSAAGATTGSMLLSSSTTGTADLKALALEPFGVRILEVVKVPSK
jgi:alpha-glucosidase